ncbi:MAG: hypothetical protein EBT09_00270, partial [Actinobacteria bacterium]|nr:hypothetical protein [Actinomycetota bacterium]
MTGDHVIAGRFRVVRTLGQGITGSVHLAEDIQDGGKRVVIKEPRQELKARAELNQERRALEQFGSMMGPAPDRIGVPRVISVVKDTQGGTGYLVTEFLGDHYVPASEFEATRGRSFTALELLRLWNGLVGILSTAHNGGFMHSDLERKTVHAWIWRERHPRPNWPEPTGPVLNPIGPEVKLIDWGMAAWPSDPGYQSPRTFISDLEGSARLVYELWTGNAFTSRASASPPAGRAWDPDLWNLLLEVCQTTYPPRYETAAQLLQDTSSLLGARERTLEETLRRIDGDIASAQVDGDIRTATQMDPDNPELVRLVAERDVVRDLGFVHRKLEEGSLLLVQGASQATALFREALATASKRASFRDRANVALRIRQATGQDIPVGSILLKDAEFDALISASEGINVGQEMATVRTEFVQAFRRHTTTAPIEALAIGLLGPLGSKVSRQRLIAMDSPGGSRLIDALLRSAERVRPTSRFAELDEASSEALSKARQARSLLGARQAEQQIEDARRRATLVQGATAALDPSVADASTLGFLEA